MSQYTQEDSRQTFTHALRAPEISTVAAVDGARLDAGATGVGRRCRLADHARMTQSQQPI